MKTLWRPFLEAQAHCFDATHCGEGSFGSQLSVAQGVKKKTEETSLRKVLSTLNLNYIP